MIYDCCMFFDELDMLETRFHILGDVVDYFVVCEAPETHSGQPKPLYFWQAFQTRRFQPWRDQIIYVNAGTLSDGQRTSWDRERRHRAQIAEGLHGAQATDWVIVGDCDEIVNPDAVETLRALPRTIQTVQFELDFYYYDVNHRVDQGWAIGAARWGTEHDPNRIRTCNGHTPFVMDSAGWHFSYFGGAAAIVQKVDAFMHHNDPIIRDLPRNADYVAAKVAASLDLFGRDLKIMPVPTAPSLPAYLLEHRDHFEALGWVHA